LTQSATCDTILAMRKAGIREARQNLTALLDDVRNGREILITDRGRPVARLVPIESHRGFPDLARVRASTPRLARSLSQAVMEDRDERS